MSVHLLSLATALPVHVMEQAAAKDAARSLFTGRLGDLDRRLSVFDHAGIDRRHSCLPLLAHMQPRGFGERNRLYLQHGLALLVEAARHALARAGLNVEDIDAVVTVSSTGIATPSLDAVVGEAIGLRPDVQRTPLFGLGCAGGALGLARSAALARAQPGSRVLLMVVELCTLTFRLDDPSLANLVASALFADGAAAAVLSTEGTGPIVAASGEWRWPDTLDVMGWNLEDDGLGVLFAVSVPEIARTRMGEAAQRFLSRDRLVTGDIERWVCHPGGAKVIVALEEALQLVPGTLADARDVLRNNGNMSAPTVLFVLDQALREGGWKNAVLTALGPGFSAGFVRIEQ